MNASASGQFFAFIVAASLQGPLVGRAIVNATTYEAIDGLPDGGQVRLVPREVAEQNAASAFNSPTETLTDFRITNTADGLRRRRFPVNLAAQTRPFPSECSPRRRAC